MKKLQLFTLFLLLACSSVFAQSIQCFELLGKEALPSEMDCFRYDFPFFLKLKEFDPTITEFTTCEFTIQGHLEGGSINENLSLSQVHPNLMVGDLTFSGNDFQYEFIGNPGDITIPLGSANNLITITGQGLPGEHLNLVIDNVIFFVECAGTQCNFESSNANEFFGHPGQTIPMAPDCSNSDWEVALGNEIINGDLVRIPVALNSSNGLSLSELDFSFSVSDLYDIANIDVQATLDSYNGPGVLQFDNGVFYLHEVSASNTPLFYPDGAVLFEIWLTSFAGTTVNVDFDFARMKDFHTDECCAPEIVSNPVIIPGDPPCVNPEVIFRVSEPKNGGDCSVRYIVSLVETQSLFDVFSMRMELEVNLGAGMTINSINSLFCPGPSICPSFSNFNDCLDVDGTTIEYGFCEVGGQLLPGGVPLFEIIVDGDFEDCVNSIVFNEAEISLVGSSTCTPLVEEAGEFCLMGIAGEVLNHCDDEPVADVTIRATPNSAACSAHQTSTDADGAYAQCTCNEAGTTYNVVPSKDGEDICGVSTLDLVLIQRHLLGLQLFDSPYQIIASDVNCDDKVAASDLLTLRKLILGIFAELPNCDSWDFVDAAYIFPDPQDPFNPLYPDYVDVVLPDSEANFVGIKLGDVNCSGDDCGSGLVGGGNSGDIKVVCDVVSVKKGEEFELPFKGHGFNPMVAYQMGIKFNTDLLKFAEVVSGNVSNFSTDNFGLEEVGEGAIRTSWLPENGEPGIITDGDVLFSIKFIALNDIPDLSEVITAANEIMACEAYMPSTRTFGIKLIFTEGGGRGNGKGKGRSSQVESIGLDLTVYPNPIAGNEVYFTFDLPQANHTSLRIYDLLGKVVYQQTIERPAGFQQIIVNGLEQLASGVYTYSFETEQEIQTGKIVKR